MSVALACQQAPALPRNQILHGDNLPLLRLLPDESVRLIYVDPPFNTGKKQSRRRIKSVADQTGDRNGFGDRRYASEVVSEVGYNDRFDDYPAFLEPRLREAYRVLTADGSLFFHIDWRESARCRLLLEDIFGGDQHCLNEIIWAYDYGARSRRKWSSKHDNIYWFAKDPANYIFNDEALPRIPYMAPDLVGAKKSARGKTPTDVWWHTIVPTNSREKTGYPTQKPLDLLRWIVAVHSQAGDVVLDFFAGSGTCGVAAQAQGRQFVLIDSAKTAVQTMRKRLNAPAADEADEADKTAEAADVADAADADKAAGAPDRKQALLAAIGAVKKTWRPDRSVWLGSPTDWLHLLSPDEQHKAGEAILTEYLALFNIQMRRSGRALYCRDKKLSLRLALAGDSHGYRFDAIKQSADYYGLLGIAPQTIHLWVLPADEYKRLRRQGGGGVTVNLPPPGEGIDWRRYGGDLHHLTPAHFDFI